MDIVKDIVYNLEGFFLFYTIILFARYVYFLPLVKNRKLNAIFLGIWFVLSVFGPLIYKGTPAPIHVVMLIVYFFMCSPKKPSRALIIIIPVLLMLFSILSSYNLYKKVVDEKYRIMFYIIYAVVIVAEILFMIFAEKWRLRFENELQFRKVSLTERGALYGSSLLVFLLTCYICDYYTSHDESLDHEQRYILAIAAILIIAIGFAVMTAVIRGNRSAYFKMIAERNEHYLELQMERYNASKELEQETRRIRHDMKNHLLSVGMLLEDGKTEEARKYIESITKQVEKLSPDISTGHMLVDAILSDKRKKAMSIGAVFDIDGNVPKELNIENVDLCTILANGLDNAIEALGRIEEGKRIIKCEFKQQGGMLYINLRNTTAEKFTGETSKEDKKNHGFGLMNMRMAVEKYDGVMEVRTDKIDGDDYFIVEIIM